MNKAMRWLALTGASVAAGAMIGSSAAQAAPAVSASTGSATGNSVQSWNYDDDYVFGPFRGKWECNRFGMYGDRIGAWDRYYCFPSFYPGSGRGWYLKVQEDYWQWDDWDGGWDNDWPYKPNYIGGPLSFDGPHHGGRPHHGFPGKGHPGFPGKGHHGKGHPGKGFPGKGHPGKGHPHKDFTGPNFGD
ncbi:hypothetical protein [Actinoplanes sp. GCM10030250]|uniref:hypothetical protein n=1 Tax=Actinoplanes sp. GCM10030250 TaxID=3273376 RepID=UPI003623A2D5